MSNTTSKPRKVYCRQNIFHICWKGKLFAPVDSLKTRMQHGEAVTAELQDDGSVVIASGRDGVEPEAWIETVIPSKKEQKAAAEAALVAEQEAAIASKISESQTRRRANIGTGLNIFDLSDDDLAVEEEEEAEVA
jgi:hypothetical protein